MKYSQAVNAMFRGYEVALRSEPGIRYSFDGADGNCVWAHYENREIELQHIDNVDFARMMKDDWYVIPQDRYYYQPSTRRWTFLNLVASRRFTYPDVIAMSILSATLITPFWWVGSLACLGALLSFLFVERKWGTNV